MLRIAAVIVAAACAVAFAAAPADAATKKRPSARAVAQQRVATAGPPRARITVRRRPYWDAGTEVQQGERKFLDYALPPGYLAQSPVDPYRGGDIQRPMGPWYPGL